MQKTIQGRIQHKHDIQSNWDQAANFQPLAGELIIYDPDDNHTVPRVKIGDGLSKVVDADKDKELPFITDSTLTVSGGFADAHAVGKKLQEIEDKIHNELKASDDGLGNVTLKASNSSILVMDDDSGNVTLTF